MTLGSIIIIGAAVIIGTVTILESNITNKKELEQFNNNVAQNETEKSIKDQDNKEKNE